MILAGRGGAGRRGGAAHARPVERRGPGRAAARLVLVGSSRFVSQEFSRAPAAETTSQTAQPSEMTARTARQPKTLGTLPSSAFFWEKGRAGGPLFFPLSPLNGRFPMSRAFRICGVKYDSVTPFASGADPVEGAAFRFCGLAAAEESPRFFPEAEELSRRSGAFPYRFLWGSCFAMQRSLEHFPRKSAALTGGRRVGRGAPRPDRPAPQGARRCAHHGGWPRCAPRRWPG